jgi:hypothetical protein
MLYGCKISYLKFVGFGTIWSVDVGDAPYEFFVHDVECIVEESRLEDHIVVMGDFKLPKISWVDFDDFGLSPLSVTTDLIAKLVDD